MKTPYYPKFKLYEVRLKSGSTWIYTQVDNKMLNCHFIKKGS